MNLKLTKREQFLLTFLGLLGATLFITIFMIQPFSMEYQNAVINLEQAELDKIDVESKLENEVMIYQLNERLLKTYESNKDRFPEMISNEEISRLFNNLFITNRLIPRTLKIELNTEQQESTIQSVYVAINALADTANIRSLVSELSNREYINVNILNYEIKQEVPFSAVFEIMLVDPNKIIINQEKIEE